MCARVYECAFPHERTCARVFACARAPVPRPAPPGPPRSLPADAEGGAGPSRAEPGPRWVLRVGQGAGAAGAGGLPGPVRGGVRGRVLCAAVGALPGLALGRWRRGPCPRWQRGAGGSWVCPGWHRGSRGAASVPRLALGRWGIAAAGLRDLGLPGWHRGSRGLDLPVLTPGVSGAAAAAHPLQLPPVPAPGWGNWRVGSVAGGLP